MDQPQREDELNEERMPNLKLVVNNDKKRKATGGKEPPDSKDWLSKLEPVTVFLVKEKPGKRTIPSFALPQFHLLQKKEGCALLLSNLNEKRLDWVDTIEFCNHFDFWKKVGYYDLPPDEVPEKIDE